MLRQRRRTQVLLCWVWDGMSCCHSGCHEWVQVVTAGLPFCVLINGCSFDCRLLQLAGQLQLSCATPGSLFQNLIRSTRLTWYGVPNTTVCNTKVTFITHNATPRADVAYFDMLRGFLVECDQDDVITCFRTSFSSIGA